MKYKVTLNNKVFEVEVEEGKAVILSEGDVAAAPAPAPAPAAAPTAPVAPAAPAGSGDAVTSPLPGTVLDVKVQNGQSVKSGDVLVVVEAMKMENEIMAPRDGVISSVATSKGAAVESGTPLVYLA